MPVTVGYDSDQRLFLDGLSCGCPFEHHIPTQDVYVGERLLDCLPDIVGRRISGKRALIICDRVTYEIAGGRVMNIMHSAGYQMDLCRIERVDTMEPDERAVGEVVMSMRPETELLVSVGSGSITDIVRAVAYLTGRPQVCVGTAPSMDGYTSAICPLLLRGAKVHRHGECPCVIVCDLDVLRAAPVEMFQSGIGDVLGKFIAKADWVIGGIINDEAYCPACGDIALDAAKRVLENPESIRARSREGTKMLIEALLLAGLTVMVIGNTRAVASIEHNIAHYWEMMQLARGAKPPAHGASVGIATLLVWPLYERFRDQDLGFLNNETYLENLRETMMTRRERETWMRHAFGPSIGDSFMAENPEDFLTWDERKRRALRALNRRKEIRAELERLPSYEDIRRAMLAVGMPTTAREIGIDDDMLRLSLRCGKDYRSRYTLMKLLDEVGLLNEYLQ